VRELEGEQLVHTSRDDRARSLKRCSEINQDAVRTHAAPRRLCGNEANALSLTAIVMLAVESCLLVGVALHSGGYRSPRTLGELNTLN
jgi:hypothetical protein